MAFESKAACPICGHSGMVGHEREFVGAKAVTVFKCHHCNQTWQVPDDPNEPVVLRRPARG